MLDWTNPKDYEFAEKLDRSEWAWEFMRRNPLYRAEFAGLGSAKAHYNPPKKDGETESAPEWPSPLLIPWRSFG